MSRSSAIDGLGRIASNLRPSASLPASLSSLRIYPTDANLLVLYSRDSIGVISPHPQPRRLGVILPSRRRMRKRQLTLHPYVLHKRPVAPSRVVAATDVAASAVVRVGVTYRRTCHFLWGPGVVVFRTLIVYLHPLQVRLGPYPGIPLPPPTHRPSKVSGGGDDDDDDVVVENGGRSIVPSIRLAVV
jgi:hypothetical protein